jgi:hypothetical protein
MWLYILYCKYVTEKISDVYFTIQKQECNKILKISLKKKIQLTDNIISIQVHMLL